MPKIEKPVFTPQVDDDNFLESSIIQPEETFEDKIPILNITSTAAKPGVTSTEFAEMIDVTLPVPEFEEKIKNMAHKYPFELDNFQKQVSYFHFI